MKRFEDAAFCEQMRLRYDFNNMMAHRHEQADVSDKYRKQIGALTEEELAAALPMLQKAYARLQKKWGKPSYMMAWSKLPYHQKGVVEKIRATAKRVAAQFDSAVVLGIGGSALGPIAVQQALNHLHYNELPRDKRPGPRFYVVDNVDPERMNALLDVIDIEKTCFILVTKSGSTSETMSQTLIVFDYLRRLVGEAGFAKQVICVTDRSKGNLVRIADEYGLTKFVVPDGVGGRFSELCPVGLLPAAICGIDIEELLAGAAYMDTLSKNEDLLHNSAYMAALISYLTMKKGKNIQVMMPYADSLKYIADWYAQLWAESLGKKYNQRHRAVHTGQTPVKAVGVTDQHSVVQLFAEGPFDKVVTFLAVDAYRSSCAIPDGFADMPNVNFLCGHTLNELIDSEQKATAMALCKQGKLNQTITLPEVNAFTLGQLLYFFMVQTAVCGELLGIDAFDQPGVEEGKNLTYALLGRPGFDEKRAEIAAFAPARDEFVL